MPRGNTHNLIPAKKGELRNPYGRGGKPENREELKKKKMEEKIIKKAVMKELSRILDKETGLTVLDRLVTNVIEQAGRGNDRLFTKLVDIIDGPIAQKNEIETNQPLGVLILPPKDYSTMENEDNV